MYMWIALTLMMAMALYQRIKREQLECMMEEIARSHMDGKLLVKEEDGLITLYNKE